MQTFEQKKFTSHLINGVQVQFWRDFCTQKYGMIRIEINPTYQHLSDWIGQLPEVFAHQGTILYDARNQIRLLSGPDGQMYCVKRYHQPSLLNRIIYTWLRSPKAQRAYENALRLQQRCIPTPAPIAYLLCFQGLITESYLVTEACPLSHSLYDMGLKREVIEQDMLREFGTLCARLHEQGVLHKDFSPGNILYDRVNGEWQFSIVDINRMRFQPISLQQGCRNMERLWGTQDMFDTIADAYAQTRHADAAECRRLIAQARRHYWSHHVHNYIQYQ